MRNVFMPKHHPVEGRWLCSECAWRTLLVILAVVFLNDVLDLIDLWYTQCMDASCHASRGNHYSIWWTFILPTSWLLRVARITFWHGGSWLRGFWEILSFLINSHRDGERVCPHPESLLRGMALMLWLLETLKKDWEDFRGTKRPSLSIIGYAHE